MLTHILGPCEQCHGEQLEALNACTEGPFVVLLWTKITIVYVEMYTVCSEVPLACCCYIIRGVLHHLLALVVIAVDILSYLRDHVD